MNLVGYMSIHDRILDPTLATWYVGMEDEKSGLDLTAAVWSRGGEKERRRLLTAAALWAHVREREMRQESHVYDP
jgi:hypothetical protein